MNFDEVFAQDRMSLLDVLSLYEMQRFSMKYGEYEVVFLNAPMPQHVSLAYRSVFITQTMYTGIGCNETVPPT